MEVERTARAGRAALQARAGARPERRGAPGRGVLAHVALPLVATAAGVIPCAAATDPASLLHPHNATGLAVLVGLIVFATILSVLHLRERSGWQRREAALAREVAALRGAFDRAELLLGAERQAVVTWAERDAVVVEGDAAFLAEETPGDVLAFARWLRPADAAALAGAVETLRDRGTAFRALVHTPSGRLCEAEGRAVSGRALLRLREITGERRELASTRVALEEAHRGLTALAALLDGLPQPLWRRDREGRLIWVNRAYAAAVEAEREAAVTQGRELVEGGARQAGAEEGGSRRATGASPLRVSAVVAGARRTLDLTEVPIEGGSVGIAIDVSEMEALRQEIQRHGDANTRTLDQLPTAVAIFDARQRLTFHNAAYRGLWDLDAAWLDGRPQDGEILERLRAARQLPEQANFREWKAGVLAAYRAAEAQETWWHLPDGRMLRVVADPNPQGGLTYLFEDVSERLDLESRYNALMRVQGETLDTLREPVAVFGQDGRLKLVNRAFAVVWRLDPATLADRPHIDAVAALCRPLNPGDGEADDALWSEVRGAVAGGADARTGLTGRQDLRDGTVLDWATQPLPDGATLVTFIDVTASVNVERALTDKNDALERASRLRDEFVHHVSYELRSPLTNIIGFTQLLGDETVGALNERQREYADHIMRSSAALLVIINDILDLASIDAGSMELTREPVDVHATIDAAVSGVEDRLAEARTRLERDVPDDIGSVVADGKRIRQILFNLLSNAIAFSAPGQTVRVRARKTHDSLVLEVADQGLGIPPEVLARVFQRFESNTLGTRHRGVGLGLSIVRSFVELHGGRVEIASAPGDGTRVTCIFPLAAAATNLAAAE